MKQKKFPYINTPLFRKKHLSAKKTQRKRKYSEAFPEQETFDTLWGNWKTHQHHSLTSSHSSAKELEKQLFSFFPRYKNHKDYEITKLKEFHAELEKLEKFVKEKWTLKECQKYYKSIKTYYCESKFALANYFLPKNTFFHKNYLTQLKLTDLHWDESHIAKQITSYYGNEERKRRKLWPQRARKYFLETYPSHQN